MEHLLGFIDLDWLVSEVFVHGGTIFALSALSFLVGYAIGRVTAETPAKRRRQLVTAIPSLSIPERAILLIAASMGDVWATDEMKGPASSLMSSGYLTATYTGGLKGDCYVIDAKLKAEIEKSNAAVKALQEARDYPTRWGYDRR